MHPAENFVLSIAASGNSSMPSKDCISLAGSISLFYHNCGLLSVGQTQRVLEAIEQHDC